MFGSELTDADASYPELVRRVLPGSLLGFYAAVLFGAILSSFNSLLNSSATLFGFDLYKKFFNRDANEQIAVKAGKRFGLGLAIISMTIAPFIGNAESLFSYIQQALGSLSVPILAVVTIGILTKKVPAIGAKIVLIGGVIMYLISLLLLGPAMVESALVTAAAEGITDPNQLAVIQAEAYPHYLHIMGILFVVNVIIMLVIGAMNPKTDEYVPKVTEAIDTTPWKYATLVGILISLLVLSTYLIF
jgi:SSS family solute:Na+ symporter